jgi:DNA-binding ferritin-like protein
VSALQDRPSSGNGQIYSDNDPSQNNALPLSGHSISSVHRMLALLKAKQEVLEQQLNQQNEDIIQNSQVLTDAVIQKFLLVHKRMSWYFSTYVILC